MALILKNLSPHPDLDLLWPGYQRDERGDGKTYSARFKCDANKVNDAKPVAGDPCPEDTGAYAQNINISYLTPDVCIISVTYSTVTLIYSVDRNVGDIEAESDFIEATEVSTEGVEYRKPHALWKSRRWVSRWDAEEQMYYQSLVGHSNSVNTRLDDEYGGNEQYYLPYTLLCLGTKTNRITKNKYLREIYFEYNPSYWDTTLYTPYDFNTAIQHIS